MLRKWFHSRYLKLFFTLKVVEFSHLMLKNCKFRPRLPSFLTRIVHVNFFTDRFRDERGGVMQMGGRRRDRNDRRPMDNNFHRNNRQRSRSPDYRRYDRESRDRRHKDRVKEFLKEDRYVFIVY